jgi:hypothetical protein
LFNEKIFYKWSGSCVEFILDTKLERLQGERGEKNQTTCSSIPNTTEILNISKPLSNDARPAKRIGSVDKPLVLANLMRGSKMGCKICIGKGD